MRRPRGANLDVTVREAISSTIHCSKLSCSQIADKMASLLGVRVSEKMLRNYSAESMQPYRLPAQWICAFCAATGDYRLLRVLVARSGFRMIGAKEERLIGIGRAFEQRAKAEKRLAEATQ